MMKKKKNADGVETEAAEAVTEETKTSEDKKPETETAEDIEKKAEEEAAEIEAYDAEGNPILKKKKKRKSKKKKTQKPEEASESDHLYRNRCSDLLFYPELCRLSFQGRWFFDESDTGG